MARTIQDVLDEMTPEEKDLQALIVGAALEDVYLSEDSETVEQYDALSLEKKDVIEFVLGNVLAEEELKHSEAVGAFLAHFGVKGMKWGVRKERSTGTDRLSKSVINNPANRSSARETIRLGGTGALPTHVAQLKSTGHRAVNALTGDKTFWKRMAITAGVTAATLAATNVGVGLLPTDILASVGSKIGESGATASAADNAAWGKTALEIAGITVAWGGGIASTVANVATNTGRAVRGNARVDKSAQTNMGRYIYTRKQTGTEKIAETLGKKRAEREAKKAIKHDGFDDPAFPNKGGTAQDILDSMTPEQKDLQALIVGAAVEGVDLSETPGVLAQYEALTDAQKIVINFVVGGILSDEELKHALQIDNFLAHFGVKGMKWGVRQERSTTTTRLSKSVENTPGARAKARQAVKFGEAGPKTAHLAALKSTGHRAVNAFTGDKTFWKRAAITAGVSAVSLGASAVAPGFFPDALLSSIGKDVARPQDLAGLSITSGSLVSYRDVGHATLMTMGATATAVGAAAVTAVNAGTNAVRAVRNNARVDKSAEANFGKLIYERQRTGTDKVASVLGKGKKKLKKVGDRLSDASDIAHMDIATISKLMTP